MSLIITRRPGEAVIVTGGGLPPRRVYVVAVEGNTVRLALDAPPEVVFTREELLPETDRRRWWMSRDLLKVGLFLCTTFVLDRLLLLKFL